ncbi:MAG: OmpA family protein [Candidatus Abyssobacteria bacterium SURF_5]|uniref:OmpA family protein n=1 Tax=Abyssobacteria bacterium (strain SURF_5) TaxID=2093360 RepID=A0A3A4NF05_ABYX5|nr:MAG: OmpA family protein [Candidatus Abyssubacteria bacterium SURF_5]
MAPDSNLAALRQEAAMGRLTPLFLSLVLAGFLFSACASLLVRKPKTIDAAADPIYRLDAELNAVAQAERTGNDSLVVRFSNVALFDVDEYSLRVGAERMLVDVVEVLKAFPDYLVVVEGHTDSEGEEGYNQWLSERRSRLVADFLVSHGLDPYSIQVVGYGESRPLTRNNTAEGRRQNRRVELHIRPKHASAGYIAD